MQHAALKAEIDLLATYKPRELLAFAVAVGEAISSQGAFADAPYELTNALDAIAPAARDGLEWLGDQQQPRPESYACGASAPYRVRA